MVRHASALLCLVLATAAPASAGEPKPAAVRAYERGARELEFGRFGEAAQAFAAAIALDPDESPQPVARPSGMNFEPYLPHLALGVALCESGEIPAAAASWAESDRQAAARASRGAARLLLRRTECSDRHRESLSQAEGTRASAPSPAVDVASAAPPAIVGPQPEESAPAVPPAGPGEIEPRETIAAAPPAVLDSPPRALLRAAQELFDGRPAEALALLERFASERSRARAQAHLLRAAACFDLARLEPDSADEWLARARSERRAAIGAAPALAPDRRFFAPAFVVFFADSAQAKPLPDLLAR
ncbi:MAG: hypothetical protein KBF21_08035 [Thermoanaerobaculia bacterium]|jgi:hypothetical protein|nr:hypothetical protein [Thermoanaerobaculia bacterium]MBP9824157.1 hypothetical protein [Thermoanaerobaculia bacterium]